eukprot:CAMPEP_0194433522 /NCGR_PEP_ID=MMETSP0176-20130528/77231_1 /TAXON_ID=216777 /ORGANISM="Proboscia alata, Strain PI-D3" /LENGTH=171 /DNA_ID=CAMNT_0039250813 /DNA_START=1 /DNA_END=512 /DNA_ORIENTATION=+
MWALFSMACVGEITAVAFYWALQYVFVGGMPITWITWMQHCLICVFVFIDGFIIGRIPLRAKQVIFPMNLLFWFWFWTAIHYIFGIGVGNKTDGNEGSDDKDVTAISDDDSLYPGLINWGSLQGRSTAISFVMTAVLSPLVFYMCWMVSFYGRQRYKSDVKQRKNKKGDDG